MKVIGLCGYAGAGKDLAAKCLIDIGWQRVSFADPLREMALAIDPIIYASTRLSEIVSAFGWDEAKRHPEVRRLLQRLGTEAGRDILGEGIWVDLACLKIRAARLNGANGVVVTDMRFTNEHVALRDEWHATFVRICRPGVGPVNSHKSDRLLEGFVVHHELTNDGTKEELWQKILKIAN